MLANYRLKLTAPLPFAQWARSLAGALDGHQVILMRHAMDERMSIELYLYDKFLEEDGDGINLVILSEKRMALEEKMEELMKKIEPAKVDEDRNKYYFMSDLNNIFETAKQVIGYGTKS